MDVVGLLVGKLAELAAPLWSRHRFRPRLRIDLSWKSVQVWFPGMRTSRWRVVSLEVTASKSEEYVIAKGTIEASQRPPRSWRPVADLAEFLRLPVVIAANRRWDGSISGPTLADALSPLFPTVDAGTIHCRVILEDHFKTRVVSEPLPLTLPELRREESA